MISSVNFSGDGSHVRGSNRPIPVESALSVFWRKVRGVLLSDAAFERLKHEAGLSYVWLLVAERNCE
jgi:hypothetical protein